MGEIKRTPGASPVATMTLSEERMAMRASKDVRADMKETDREMMAERRAQDMQARNAPSGQFANQKKGVNKGELGKAYSKYFSESK